MSREVDWDEDWNLPKFWWMTADELSKIHKLDYTAAIRMSKPNIDRKQGFWRCCGDGWCSIGATIGSAYLSWRATVRKHGHWQEYG